jgi:exopolyphosphatase/guanosine-5'-triphosphate,3'-diphosphate pyrophosphatase
MLLAAIDIGTNAVRFTIGEVIKTKDGLFIEKKYNTRIPLKLGQDVFKKGKITKSKQEQFVETLAAFKLIGSVYGVDAYKAIATSAMRESNNTKEVLHTVQKEVGINVEVISGEEEAKLIFDGFSTLSQSLPDSYLLIDVGGGSTEIGFFKNQKQNNSRSFNIGTLRPMTSDSIHVEKEKIKSWLETELSQHKVDMVFGTGGNIRKIQKIVNRSNEQALKKSDIWALHAEMNAMSVFERQRHFNIKKERAEVLLPAMDIFLFLLESIGVDEIHAPNISLIDGIFIKEYIKTQSV